MRNKDMHMYLHVRGMTISVDAERRIGTLIIITGTVMFMFFFSQGYNSGIY